jgi:nitrogen fixation/metabolism regulation signal transduction histidine kinase
MTVHKDGATDGWFDSRKLERVFQNLLVNACEAVTSDKGDIRIDIHANKSTIEVRVADNGHGIPELVRERLFEPFVSQGKENGTGLGLTVVQKIVQDHGGMNVTMKIFLNMNLRKLSEWENQLLI